MCIFLIIFSKYVFRYFQGWKHSNIHRALILASSNFAIQWTLKVWMWNWVQLRRRFEYSRNMQSVVRTLNQFFSMFYAFSPRFYCIIHMLYCHEHLKIIWNLPNNIFFFLLAKICCMNCSIIYTFYFFRFIQIKDLFFNDFRIRISWKYFHKWQFYWLGIFPW
jgi:hypothetical protein